MFCNVHLIGYCLRKVILEKNMTEFRKTEGSIERICLGKNPATCIACAAFLKQYKLQFVFRIYIVKFHVATSQKEPVN